MCARCDFFPGREQLHSAVQDFVSLHPTLKPLGLEGQMLRRYGQLLSQRGSNAAQRFAYEMAAALTGRRRKLKKQQRHSYWGSETGGEQ